ncbi:hypothetical protein J6590_097527 [Homalodisca vitripennis]|nr:hypothetical protein J6590_097527 [Homalodisca vitripennis]
MNIPAIYLPVRNYTIRRGQLSQPGERPRTRGCAGRVTERNYGNSNGASTQPCGIPRSHYSGIRLGIGSLAFLTDSARSVTIVHARPSRSPVLCWNAVKTSACISSVRPLLPSSPKDDSLFGLIPSGTGVRPAVCRLQRPVWVWTMVR